MIQELINQWNQQITLYARKNLKPKEEWKIGYKENKTKLDPHLITHLY